MPLRPPWWWDNPIKARLKHDAVGLWQFESSGNLGLDSSPKGNALTNNNSVSQTPGLVGQAASFVSASSQSLSIADNASLSMAGNTPFTITCWAKFTTLPAGTFPGLVAKDAGGVQSEYELYYYVDDGRFYLTVSSNGTAFTNTSATTPHPAVTGTWYFLRAWYDLARINLRVNEGNTFSSPFTAGVFDGTSAFCIGQFARTGSFLNGAVDQVGVWKRVLTPTEAAYLYNGGTGRNL